MLVALIVRVTIIEYLDDRRVLAESWGGGFADWLELRWVMGI